jgi:hypothetical protein
MVLTSDSFNAQAFDHLGKSAVAPRGSNLGLKKDEFGQGATDVQAQSTARMTSPISINHHGRTKEESWAAGAWSLHKN